MRWLAATLVAAGLLPSAAAPGAAEYPAANITYVVPYGAGGATDRISRLLAGLSEPLLGRKIIVINRPGASATLGTSDVFWARPDGYTIGFASDNALNFQPLRAKLPYRSAEDFRPIFKFGAVPFVLVVRAGAPWQSLTDFVAEARRRPGELRAGVSGKLTPPDLVAQHFAQKASIDLTTVPFTGGGAESVAALLGGHVESAVEGSAGVVAHVEAGKLRALAVFSSARVPVLPDVPASVELGYDVTLPAMHLVIGPRGLDGAVVAKLSRTFAEAWRQPVFQNYLRANGYAPADRPLTPDEIRAELEASARLFVDLARTLSIGPPR